MGISTMMRALLSVVLALCVAGITFAGGFTVEMNNYWSAEEVNSSAFDLNVNVFEEDGSAVFAFINDSKANLPVVHIFFEQGLSNFVNLATPQIMNTATADFVTYGGPNHKAWYSRRDVGWTTTGLAMQDNGKSLLAGDMLMVKFELNGSVTIEEVAMGLTQVGSRIGVNAEFNGDKGAAAVTNTYHTPTPTAASAGMLLVGGLLLKRRRK